MALPAAVQQYSPEEYLALERAADFRSDYIDGEVVAIVGASYAHSLIATNLGGQMWRQLRDRPCAVHLGDLRVKVAGADKFMYTYPDVTVICGEPVFDDEHHDTLVNPTLIVEVLSPSTEAHDRGEKFARYRQLASLQEVVLVAQDRARVERYLRRDEEWVLAEASGLESAIELSSIGCTLTLAVIYAKVSLKRPTGPAQAAG